MLTRTMCVLMRVRRIIVLDESNLSATKSHSLIVIN